MLQEVVKGFPDFPKPIQFVFKEKTYPFKSKVESHPFQPLRKSTSWWFLPCVSYAPFSLQKASIEQKPYILGSYKVMRVYIQDTQFRIKRYLFTDNHPDQLYTLFQKEIICGPSHIQWKSDPFTLLHLKHVSGILGLKWYNLAGVMYCLVSHLYCSNLECVLVVRVWAKEQAFDHSSCVIICFKSNFQACKILFEDSLHYFANRLYNKDTWPLASWCFKVMFSKVDRGGSSKPPWQDLIQLGSLRYLKKCFAGIPCVSELFKWHKCSFFINVRHLSNTFGISDFKVWICPAWPKSIITKNWWELG